MPKKQFKRLWSVVKKLILEHYQILVKRSIRGSYYIIGDRLAPLIGKEIAVEDYNWFGTDQGYATYRDDVWPLIEQQHGLERPEAAAIGVVYDDGVEYPITRLEKVWDQARGFIFVEKADEAKDLEELSRFGWTVVAGKGYPLRLVRKLLKEDRRPVLALHDWDRDGEGIYRALGFETRRTRHLDIALGQRVTDLGLTQEHVNALNLPTRPSPPKYKGKPRVELSGLAVLSTRLGLENPVLSYTVATTLVRELKLSPTEVSKEELVAKHLRWALTDGLKGVVNDVVKDLMGELKPTGTAVTGTLDFDEPFEMEGLHEALKDLGEDVAERIKWRSEADYEKEAFEKFANEHLIQILKGA